MSPSPRPQRVADRIQAELSEIVRRRLKDPRRGFLTLTAVEVTNDLQLARVFVSAPTDEETETGIAVLRRAKGFLRSELGKRLGLRHTPDLQFLRDRSLEHGLRVAEILSELERKGELDGEDDAGEEE